MINFIQALIIVLILNIILMVYGVAILIITDRIKLRFNELGSNDMNKDAHIIVNAKKKYRVRKLQVDGQTQYIAQYRYRFLPGWVDFCGDFAGIPLPLIRQRKDDAVKDITEDRKQDILNHDFTVD